MFNKETSDKIVIVDYMKITISTSTEIVYTGRSRRSLKTILLLYLLITLLLKTVPENTFVCYYKKTPVDDYK